MFVNWIFDARGDLCGDGPATCIGASRSSVNEAGVVSRLKATTLGIEVQERRSCFLIEFEAQRVTPQALTGVLIWLNHATAKPCVIRDRSGQTRTQLYLDHREAIAHIARLIEARTPQPRFERWQVPLELSCFARHVPIAQEVLRSEMADDARLRILETLFQGMFTWNAFDEPMGCRPVHLGSAVNRYDPSFAAVIETGWRNLRDKTYGAWVADAFEDFFHAQVPFAETVHARMNLAAIQGQACYTRVVVPCEARGRKFVLTAAEPH